MKMTATEAQPRTGEARVFGYVRASTAKQVDSPDVQRGIHAKYADYNNLGEITSTFMDAAISGKTPMNDRPAGKQLLLAIRPGDHVIISKLDRMFRNVKDCVNVLEEFKRKNVSLHVCDLMGGALDLSSPMGEFLITILAAVAQLERAYISQRTKDGLAAKKRNKVKHSRHAGYGKKWEKRKIDGKMVCTAVPDHEEREIMISIVRWRTQLEPYTWEEIETHLANTGQLTKEGKRWDQNRIRRACKAEFLLQSQEQRSTR